MSDSLKDKTAIVGIAQTEYGKGIERDELVLALEVAKGCVEDAGITGKEVDGIIRYDMQANEELEIARNIGCNDLKVWGSIGWGGGASCATIAHAAALISAGMAENVLCIRSRKRSAKGSRVWAQTLERVSGPWGYEAPYGCVRPVDQVAMYTRQHMLKYGTTIDHLGWVAIANRKHAMNNPAAQMRKPMTMEDHHNSRMICDPLRLFDNGLESDGACGVLVTSAERAKSMKQKPIYISGAVQAASRDPFLMGNWYKPGWVEMHSQYAGDRLYKMAEITPKDIDVALLYDVFTTLIIYQLEEYGFCKRGEGGPFVENGRIEWPDGELPVNTHGGSLSEAYIHGMNHVVEAVKQLRGVAINQVKDAETALVTAGPVVPTSALILRR